MKKYFWLIAGSGLGFVTVVFAYLMLGFLVTDGVLNSYAVVTVILVYSLILATLGLFYDKLN